MLAREVMTSPVVSIGPEASVKDAVRLLDRHDITALPVIDDRDRLVGIVSEADVLLGEVSPDPRAHVRPVRDLPEAAATVADVMTRAVMTVHKGADVADIAQLMLDTGVKSVPVTHGHQVVGIVSRRDLIHALARADDRIQAEIQDLFTEAGLAGWTVWVDDSEVQLAGPGSERDTRIATILARTVPGVGDVHLAAGQETR
jgi:CBS-domain-containing membrane protein